MTPPARDLAEMLKRDRAGADFESVLLQFRLGSERHPGQTYDRRIVAFAGKKVRV
jgi:hypothetical protein